LHFTKFQLKEKFQIGPKVLRISQISGWISGEVKRRKKQLVKAVAAAENMAVARSGDAAAAAGGDSATGGGSSQPEAGSSQAVAEGVEVGVATLKRKGKSMVRKRAIHTDSDEEENSDDEVGEDNESEGEESSDDDDEEAEFDVSAVVGKETRKDGSVWYKCRWLGYGNADATWEPIESLVNLKVLIDQYEQSVSGGNSSKKRKRDSGNKELWVHGECVAVDEDNEPNWLQKVSH
jgi:hypothetical protein